MTKKKIGAIVATVVCIVLCALAIFWNSSKNGEETVTPKGESTTYSVTVNTEGGMAVSGISVYVYGDDSLQDLIWVASTDDMGQITFQAQASDSYVATLVGVPEGYEVAASYPLTGANTVIRIKTALVQKDDLSEVTYKLGDVIYDFSVTTPDGTVYTVSELLKEKKAVALNFWYIGCDPCKTEFPFLQEAYETYRDDVEVLAMNPLTTDDSAIAAFQEEMGLTFPVVQCGADWETSLQIEGYPTTVIIDRYGVISLIHSGAVTNAESFEQIFAYFVSDDYEQSTIDNLEDIVTYVAEEGSKENAKEVGGVSDFEATVKPGEEVYFSVYKVTNMNLRIADEDAYVIYDEKTYNPVDGVVSLTVSAPDTFTPAKFGIGNSGKEEKTFAVYFNHYAGTSENPYTLELDKFTTQLSAGNDQGVYYTYTATKKGTLTLQCTDVTSGVDYDYSIYNLDTYAFRTLSSDGTSKKGVDTLKMVMQAGETVQIAVQIMPNDSNEYPAATFQMKASFGKTKKGEEIVVKDMFYEIVVKDEKGKTVPGVSFLLKNGTESTQVMTNMDGVASVSLALATYQARLILPEGYTSRTTQYYLTAEEPSLSIVLSKKDTKLTTYSVTVVDDSGAPIKNALVLIGDVYAKTNAKGVAKFKLVKGSYTAIVSVPDGYYLEDIEYSFGNKTTSKVVAENVGAGGDGTQDGDDNQAKYLTYRVSVVDVSEKDAETPLKNVVVRFLKDGKVKGVKMADANGEVELLLPADSYNVELAFESDSDRGYVSNASTVTKKNTSIVVPVAKKLEKTDSNRVSAGSQVSYLVYEGATYTTLTENIVNYFTFKVEEQGLYQISTTDSKAQIKYYGGNAFFINEQDIDYANNSFTLNVKENTMSANTVRILGVTGASECIIKIERIGDSILEDADVPYTIYTAKKKPTSFTYKGGTLTSVDMTGADIKLVLGSDGYYHIGSSTGKIMYINLGANANYVSLDIMINGDGTAGGAGFKSQFYENGNLVKEDYTSCMQQYISCMDKKTGVYPLTEDLVYMLQKGGEFQGWWNKTSSNYLFSSIKLNTNIAWMFACCYEK